jgi:hypothetical protein
MRITGWFLLVAGLLLCVSIVWAAIGFFMMGWGLICLLIAEQRRKKSLAGKSSPPSHISNSVEISGRREPSMLSEQQNTPVVKSARTNAPFESPSLPQPRDEETPKPVVLERKERVPRRPRPVDLNSYDTEKWRVLVASDVDISRSLEALAPFGRKYVDQLATAYLAFNEKSYLPIIMKMTVANVKKDTGRHRTGAIEFENEPVSDLISLSKTTSSTSEPVGPSTSTDNARALGLRPTGNASPGEAPAMDPAVVAGRRPLHGLSEAGNDIAGQPVVREPEPVQAARSVAPRAVIALDSDDTLNLTDLLRQIA